MNFSPHPSSDLDWDRVPDLGGRLLGRRRRLLILTAAIDGFAPEDFERDFYDDMHLECPFPLRVTYG